LVHVVLLAAIRYIGKPNQNRSHWNIVSTDRYILHNYTGTTGMLLHIHVIVS